MLVPNFRIRYSSSCIIYHCSDFLNVCIYVVYISILSEENIFCKKASAKNIIFYTEKQNERKSNFLLNISVYEIFILIKIAKCNL